jgi:hypothetical protein
MFAKMRLVREPTAQRNVRQGFRAFQHQSGSKLQSTSQYEGMRCYPECPRKQPRKVRITELHYRAQVRNEYSACNVRVHELLDLAYLPRQQPTRRTRAPA